MEREAPSAATDTGAGGGAPPQARRDGFDALVGQEAAVEALRRAIASGRLPHALLLYGPEGVGKATCAGVLARALNCAASGYVDACGRCVSCRKVARGLHPDVMWIAPAGAGGMIKVGQVDDVIAAVAFRPYEGRRRVVVIDEAHRLNPASQNRLLKTLEEPPPSSMIVLVTPAPQSLLATVRSRCQALRFRPLPLQALRRRLEREGLPAEEARLRAALCSGSLGRAIDFDLAEYLDRRQSAEKALHDARRGGVALLESAETLLAKGSGRRKSEQAASVMAAMRDVLRDLLVLGSGGETGLLVNADRAADWRPWAEALALDGLVAALDAVQAADARLAGPLTPNVRLTVERALVEVGAALRRPVPAS